MKPVLIVGQGICGTVLSATLSHHGIEHKVLDLPLSGRSTAAASGLYNPVAFRRMSLSWRALEAIPFATKFYQKLEKELNTQLLYPMPITRMIYDEGDLMLWKKKMLNPVYEEVIDVPSNIDESLKDIVNPVMKQGSVINSGFVDVQTLLSLYRQKLEHEGMLMEERFDYSGISFHDDEVRYRDESFESIIFCEGHRATENPFFQFLEFYLAKGELLHIRFKERIKLETILHRGIYLVPVAGKDYYWVGSTYEWNDLSDRNTEQAREEMIAKLKVLLKVDFEVLNQKNGIRPAMKNRRPVLGRHPEFSRLVMFNGMGSKGIMLAPILSEELYKHLFLGSELHSETRFNIKKTL
jgi:glycine oxidase